MSDDEREERLAREEGHRYDAPEKPEETSSKGISYLVLGGLVLLLMILIATGTVQIFNY